MSVIVDNRFQISGCWQYANTKELFVGSCFGKCSVVFSVMLMAVIMVVMAVAAKIRC